MPEMTLSVDVEIPEGWAIDRIGLAKPGEPFLDFAGNTQVVRLWDANSVARYVVIVKRTTDLISIAIARAVRMCANAVALPDDWSHEQAEEKRQSIVKEGCFTTAAFQAAMQEIHACSHIPLTVLETILSVVPQVTCEGLHKYRVKWDEPAPQTPAEKNAYSGTCETTRAYAGDLCSYLEGIVSEMLPPGYKVVNYDLHFPDRVQEHPTAKTIDIRVRIDKPTIALPDLWACLYADGYRWVTCSVDDLALVVHERMPFLLNELKDGNWGSHGRTYRLCLLPVGHPFAGYCAPLLPPKSPQKG